ncbi:MAG: efflux RND transporter periplasmic adaptor subunit [Acidobacteriota bacterium]
MNQRENSEEPPARRPVALKRWVVVAVVLLAAVAIAVTWLLTRGSSPGSIAGRPVPAPTGESVPAPPGAASTGAPPRSGEMVITLSPDKLANAQLKTEVVAEQTGMPSAGAAGIRTTGTVQSNAYKEVPVFPIAGGIVRQINIELGNKVNRGQTLATIFSSELADAEAAYLKMAAEVEEHHKHHTRTIDLVEIGAASREELEQATSMKKTAEASLASARERLILLGLSEKQIEELRTAQKFPKPLIAVESPASGTVVGRAVNTGEVVMQGKEMFRVADLSSVWVIAQIYERDFQTVNVATPAVITTSAYPGRTFNGRVSYIDPRVDPQTRTAQVRVELANPREVLRLGMFVDVNFSGGVQAAPGGQTVLAVPRSAVQTIGAKQIVYVVTDRPGSFVQREVSTGQEVNGMLPVYNGVSAGERVVTEGSFLLRAESLKLNPAQSAATASAASGEPVNQAQAATRAPQQEAGVQAVTVKVTGEGFQPDRINLRQGIPARLTFVREIEETCATSIVIPEFNIKQDLPFKEPVVLEFRPTKAGVFDFTCGMKMLSGKIVVR